MNGKEETITWLHVDIPSSHEEGYGGGVDGAERTVLRTLLSL